MVRRDAELVRGFLEGEAASVRQVDAWIREVLGHGRLRLGPDMEDVAQEVRRKLIVSLRAGRYRGEAGLRTYVWRAAQHAAIDLIRLRRTQAFPPAPEGRRDPADLGPSPEALLLREERRALFTRVLAHLGEECRRLFHFIVFDELGYAEVARRLGATEGAVKVRALRCREQAARIYQTVTAQAPGRPSGEQSL